MRINRRMIANFSLWLTKIIPIVSIIILGILWFTNFRNLTIDDILNFTPDNPITAFIVLMVLFALKSLVIFFPVTLLYLSVGSIYPVPFALLINFAGIIVCLAVPYFLGRLSGNEIIDKITRKYPKSSKYITPEKANSWFYAFVLRTVNPLPGDLRSMLLGAIGIPFKTYITSSAVASIPYLVSVTFVGANMDNPDSPAFITSLIFTGLITIGSVVVVAYLKKRKIKNNKD